MRVLRPHLPLMLLIYTLTRFENNSLPTFVSTRLATRASATIPIADASENTYPCIIVKYAE